MVFRYPDPSNSDPRAPVLLVEVVNDGKVVTVDVRGEVDIATVELMSAGIQSGLGKQPERLSVDLSQVSFFSAAGLRALLVARRHADQQGVDLVLHAPSRHVLIVVELAQVGDLFDIEYESRIAEPAAVEPDEPDEQRAYPEEPVLD